MLRAGMVLPPEEHTRLVREYLAAARAEASAEARQRRVVMNGSSASSRRSR